MKPDISFVYNLLLDAIRGQAIASADLYHALAILDEVDNILERENN